MFMVQISLIEEQPAHSNRKVYQNVASKSVTYPHPLNQCLTLANRDQTLKEQTMQLWPKPVDTSSLETKCQWPRGPYCRCHMLARVQKLTQIFNMYNGTN